MNNNKSILVVGGTGVISFAVVNEAVKQGYNVTCINRGCTRTQTLDNSIEIITSDYRDRAKIENAIKDRHFDMILDVLCYNEHDIEYSISLFGNHCDQYMFFSSAEAYNKPKYENVIHNEDVELTNPNWDYSVHKVKCEKKLIELAKNYAFKYTIVRPAITYGNTRIPYGFMPAYGFHGTIIQRILNHKPLILFNGGENIATITRVEDFAIGLVGLIGNPKAYNQAFHISGDEFVTWKQVLDTLGKVLGVEPIYISIPSETIGKEFPNLYQQVVGGRSFSQRLDNTKIKNAVPEFRTNIFLEEGIRMTVNYYKQNSYLRGIDWKFDANLDRIIRKYSNDEELRALNITLCDYLKSITAFEKLNYLLEFHKGNMIIACIGRCLDLSQRIVNKLKSFK